VTDEHDRTAEGAQELGEVGGVAIEIAKRVAEPDRGKPAALQSTIVAVSAAIPITASVSMACLPRL
jgi:hypothetical protein